MPEPTYTDHESIVTMLHNGETYTRTLFEFGGVAPSVSDIIGLPNADGSASAQRERQFAVIRRAFRPISQKNLTGVQPEIFLFLRQISDSELDYRALTEHLQEQAWAWTQGKPSIL